MVSFLFTLQLQLDVRTEMEPNMLFTVFLNILNCVQKKKECISIWTANENRTFPASHFSKKFLKIFFMNFHFYD